MESFRRFERGGGCSGEVDWPKSATTADPEDDSVTPLTVSQNGLPLAMLGNGPRQRLADPEATTR